MPLQMFLNVLLVENAKNSHHNIEMYVSPQISQNRSGILFGNGFSNEVDFLSHLRCIEIDTTRPDVIVKI